MLNIYISLILLLMLGISSIYGAETCSRVAIVNYQEILVDTGTTGKGEGLRYYLSKDEVAEKYLDEFQEQSRPKWYTAAISTAGTALILGGIFQTGQKNNSGLAKKETLFIGGAAMIALSYLVAKTIEYNNEALLARAVEEYNKRNLPRIYFSPYKSELKSRGEGDIGVQAGFVKEF